MNIKMYTTSSCGACNLVKASGVVKSLNIKVIDVTADPKLKPEDMSGAPFFVKETLTEGGTTIVSTHTGFANEEMLRAL